MITHIGANGTAFSFNSDFSGEIHITPPRAREDEPPMTVQVPAEDMISFLAGIVRSEVVKRLEDLFEDISDRELLWGKRGPSASTADEQPKE